MPPASTTHWSARAYSDGERTRNTAQSRDDAPVAKTLPGRPSRSPQGDDRRARRPASVRDVPGPPYRPPRQAATSLPRVWSSGKTPQGFRERHRSENVVTEPTTSNPANVDGHVGARPHGGKIFGFKFVDQVSELGIDDPTKLFSAARRTRKHVRTNFQEVRSTKLRQHKAAAVHRHAKLRRLRAKEVEPDRQERDRSCVPETQPQLVRREHVPPRWRRTQSAQWPASFSADAHAAKFGSSGSGSDLRDARHTRTDCPLWRDIASTREGAFSVPVSPFGCPHRGGGDGAAR